MDHFLSMDAFVRVAEVGSFAEVARQLNVSKSVITTRVQQLEEYVGVPLFHRSTRKVVISEIGQAYYEECAQLVSKANEVVDQMRRFRGSPTGVLRIHGIPGLILGHMAPFLNKFSQDHPGITYDFVVNDLVIDPVKEGFDCALQIFSPISDGLVQKKLFPVRRVFCASPGYLEMHEPILHPLNLETHHLGLYSRYPTKDKWVFADAFERVEMELKPFVRTNAVHFLKELAIEGAAVVCLPTIVAAKEILAGNLVPILRSYEMPPYWLSAVYPKTQRNSIKLKLFLERFSAEFATGAPWDLELVARDLLPAMRGVEFQ